MAGGDAAHIYAIAKSIQTTQGEVEATLVDHTRQVIRIREEINGLRPDDLRRENLQAQMDVRLDRIEARLDTHDT